MKNYPNMFRGSKQLVHDGCSPDRYLEAIFGLPYSQYRQEFRLAGSEGYVVKEFPLQLDFQLNNRCNLRCIMCPWVEPDNVPDWYEPATEFPYEKFCEIVTDGVSSSCLQAINFEGLNEPLLKNDIATYISFARDAGVLDLTMHTNALLLDKKMSKELIESGLTRLMVSLDAFTEETYCKIRRSNKFDVVMENVAEFLHLRTEANANIPLLRISFVAQPANMAEADDFRMFWAKYADYVFMQDMVDMTQLVHPERYSMTINTPQFCTQPFYRMSVKANGDVFPCCCSLGHLYLSEGNVIKNSIRELWKSKHFESVRHLLKSGRYSEIKACKSCFENVFAEPLR